MSEKSKDEKNKPLNEKESPQQVAIKILEFLESQDFSPENILIGLDIAKFQATKAYLILSKG